MAIGIALAAVSIGMKMYGAYKANEEAEKQSELDWEVTQEELRRMDIRQEQIRGTTVSSMGASGLSTESASFKRHLMKMDDEFTRERQFLADMGAERGRQTIQSGRNAAAMGYMSAASTALNTYGGYSSVPDQQDSSVGMDTKSGSFSGYGRPQASHASEGEWWSE